MTNPMPRNQRLAAIALALGLTFGAALTLQGAEPCPWEGGDLGTACAEWNMLAKRLEAAEARAAAAERSLQSMESALKSMESAIQSMGTGLSTAQSEQTTPELKIITPESVADRPEGETVSSNVADKQNEQRARAIVDRFVNLLDSAQLGLEVGRFILERDYQLQPDGTGYKTVFNQAALVVDDHRIDFAPLTLSVEPLDQGTAKVALSLADTVVGREGDEQVFRLDIGTQDIAGLWSDPAQYFLDLHTRLRDLRLTVADNQGSAAVTEFNVIHKLMLDANDSWQQRQTLSVAGVNINGDDNRFRLARVEGGFASAGRQYSRMVAINKEMQQLAAASKDAAEPPPEMLQMLGELFSLFGTYSANLNLYELAFTEAGRDLGKIGRIGFGSTLSEAATGQGSRFDYRIELEGLESDAAPLPPNLAPHEVRFEMAFDNIPPQLMRRFIETALNAENMDDEARDTFVQQQLLAFLLDSELQFDIINTFIAAREARLDISARARVDQQAAFGTTGKVSLRLEGAQTIIDATGAAQNQTIAPMVAMLTAFSNRTEENGKIVDTFDFEFTSGGKLLLNGKDVSAMFMPGAAPGQPPPQ